jgi:ATP-binding cassette subfamily F protein 3
MRGKDGLENYAGNYSFYVDEKKKRKEKAEKLYEEQSLHIESEKELINRFRAGSRAGFAKSRERQLEKIEKVQKPLQKQEIRFLFPFDKNGGETLLKIEDAFIGRKDPLFYIRDASLSRGERIGIVGENGV